MDSNNFLERYAGLKENVSPLTDDILSVCVAKFSCETCSVREKCPIRLIVFPLEDESFQMFVNMAENQTLMSHAGIVSKDEAKKIIRGITKNIVAKREAERKRQEREKCKF